MSCAEEYIPDIPDDDWCAECDAPIGGGGCDGCLAVVDLLESRDDWYDEDDWADWPEVLCRSCGAELGFDADDLCPACGEPV